MSDSRAIFVCFVSDLCLSLGPGSWDSLCAFSTVKLSFPVLFLVFCLGTSRRVSTKMNFTGQAAVPARSSAPTLDAMITYDRSNAMRTRYQEVKNRA